MAGQRPLAAPANGPLDLIVGVVQEQLDLLTRHRAPLGPALVVDQVREGVPLVTHLDWVDAETGLTLGGPLVVRRGDVVAEQPQRGLIATDGRLRTLQLRRQVHRPLIDMRGCPLPRVLACEVSETPDDLLPIVDRLGLKAPAATLLARPPLQHRIEDRVLGMQQRDAVQQQQLRRRTAQPHHVYPNHHQQAHASCNR